MAKSGAHTKYSDCEELRLADGRTTVGTGRSGGRDSEAVGIKDREHRKATNQGTCAEVRLESRDTAVDGLTALKRYKKSVSAKPW